MNHSLIPCLIPSLVPRLVTAFLAYTAPLSAFLVYTAPLSAEESGWVPMTGAEITQALSDATVSYPDATQLFYASGRTLYSAGQDSWGRWEVRGDAYCSQWPPASGWACYPMARKGDMLRFVGSAGDVTDGHLTQVQ